VGLVICLCTVVEKLFDSAMMENPPPNGSWLGGICAMHSMLERGAIMVFTVNGDEKSEIADITACLARSSVLTHDALSSILHPGVQEYSTPQFIQSPVPSFA
jgi:hypothetical protein